MKVLVTGGTGNVGKAAVRRLVESGHSITVIGRREGIEIEGARYASCDINDYPALLSVLKGHEAVVHLAAIPDPAGNPGRELFRVNDLGTFNIFEAAAEAGIERVVSASSINAFGFFYGDRGFPIDYLPIDEEHEGVATDAYSFSKQIMEKIGSYFWERDGLSGTMLRLPGVVEHEQMLKYQDNPPDAGALFARELLELPPDECVVEIQRMSDAYDRFRRSHRWDTIQSEKDWDQAYENLEAGTTEEELDLMQWRANFFTYLDELDSAQAIELSLTADYQGNHPLYVNSSRNTLGLSVE